jgi:hypothetical protein
MNVHGIDFTSAPRRAKPLVHAFGHMEGAYLVLEGVERWDCFAGFEVFLRSAGPWVGAADLPFGLPTSFVQDQGWPPDWAEVVRIVGALDRDAWRACLDAHRAPRPPGDRTPHRRTDIPAGSHSPLKLVNPPVALMFREGAPRLLAAGVHLPCLHDGDRTRVFVEGYPGFWARRISRESYKADDRSKQTPAREEARRLILEALESGQPAGVHLRIKSQALRRLLLADATGDHLDATICALQAAWAARQGPPRWGLPECTPPLEGWILDAPP